VVERVGTWIEDKTVREEVTWASCEAKKLDWIDEAVNEEMPKDVPEIVETVRVDPVRLVK
jgi:hypothetical protein